MSEDRATLDGGNNWARSGKAVGAFVNQVGIPSLIVLFILGITGAIAFQRIPSPFVTSLEFQAHQIETRSMLPVLQEQTEVLQEMKGALQGIRCDQKPTNEERLRCFQHLR